PDPHVNAMNGRNASQAIRNPPGIVRTQAHTTCLATPHRTADSRCVVPTPTIAPVIVWVVETGIPAWAVKNNVAAAAVSALMPPTGWSFVMRAPSVWTIRHPPNAVPRAIAASADSFTHHGTEASGATLWAAMSRARITPLVFWAAFVPCPR